MQNLPKLIIHTDGGARGNPGPAAVGVVIETGQETLAAFGQKIQTTTNNVAEYKAVLVAFTYLKNRGIRSALVEVYLDSTLVAQQLNRKFKIKKPHLQVLFNQVKLLEKGVGERVTYFVIPREKNTQADAFVNQSLDCLD